MNTTPTLPPAWAELNERQQRIVTAIFTVDQETEQSERGAWSQGRRPRPAEEWRWMKYGYIAGMPSPLMRAIRNLEIDDPGIGSTFNALERRRLIKVKYEGDGYGGSVPYLKMTPAGRKLVREATAKAAPKKLPTGVLQEWHWRALAEAYKAHPQGLQADSIGHGQYARIGWRTWLRLRDYRQAGRETPLVEEYSTWGDPQPHLGYTPRISWLRLTPAGHDYYRQNWQHYHDLYPAIDALEPTGT